MNKPSRKILIVDDEPDMRWALSSLLKKQQYTVFTASNGRDALKIIQEKKPAITFLDIKMPGMSGLDVLEKVKEFDLSLSIIMITAFSDVKTAVKAIQLGAFDYLVKPFDNDEILLMIDKALSRQALEEEVVHLRSIVEEKQTLSTMMGKSIQIYDLANMVKQVAFSDFSVLIQGESGTGKELVAEAIHLNSTRDAGPFVVVDCGAIPETLIESELFGYEKGAFTGAHRKKRGFFESAHNGTLFLDEITNLPMSMQPKLLRAIQSKQVTHIGSTKSIPVDFRIVCATNQNITDCINKGGFRKDLYNRLNEFTITVPPLRERKDDILFLANIFLTNVNKELNKHIQRFSSQAEKNLLCYDWPGNVRELKNVIRRAALIAKKIITPACFPSEIKELRTGKVPVKDIQKMVMNGLTWKEAKKHHQEKLERQILTKVLKQTNGNKSKAARILKMDYKTLHLKVKKLGIDIRDSNQDNS